MRRCIYCLLEKDESDFTLEHVIPKFLGGAYAPDALKTHDACDKCNNNLGLFVDASFEKNWLVHNHLKMAALAFYDPRQPIGIPLICMGNSDLAPPKTPKDHICESWLGSLGEQIYWIRPHDEKMFGFAGGNPRTAKTFETRAYFLFSERSTKDLARSFLSFKKAFEGRKVKKIMCTTVQGANLAKIGFKEPDNLDRERIDYFNTQCSIPRMRNNTFALDAKFDYRFLAKLAIGVSYCLFGEKTLHTKYNNELQKALWYKNGEPEPAIRGQSMLSGESNKKFNEIIGTPHAVTVLITLFPEGVSLNLNISAQLNWTILCTPDEILTDSDKEKIGPGIFIILMQELKKGIETDLPTYLSHKTGAATLPELDKINSYFQKNQNS